MARCVMFVLVVVVVVTLVVVAHKKTTIKDLVDEVMECVSPDKKNLLDKCLEQYFYNLKPLFVEGIPELLIPPLDPFMPPAVTLNTTHRDLFRGSFGFSGVKVVGLTSYKDVAVDMDVANKKFDLNFTVAEVFIEGKYRVNGTVMLLPVGGYDDFYIYASDSNVSMSGDVERDGPNVKVILDTVRPKITGLKNVTVHFENIMDDDEISEAFNNLLNANVKLLLNDLQKVANGTFIHRGLMSIVVGPIEVLPSELLDL